MREIKSSYFITDMQELFEKLGLDYKDKNYNVWLNEDKTLLSIELQEKPDEPGKV